MSQGENGGACDVLVVGAGPTGLAMASELARRGISCRIIEAEVERPGLSKALGVQPRTLEVFDDMGIADALLEAGVRVHGASLHNASDRIAHVDFDDPETAYPFILAIPQCETERALERRANALGLTVERGAKLASFTQDAHAVTAIVDVGGARREVRASWLIGCDGAHSTVRHALDLPFEGAKYEEGFVLADVAITWGRARDEVHAFLSPEGPMAFFPLPGESRWRIVANENDRGADPVTLDEVRAIAKARGAGDAVISDARWMTAFTIHRRIVPAYRKDRVFLAGDAAHIHSPVGGQGMNTGIQDAYNLAWKLALVHKGSARASLLDSYDDERRPIAAATLHATDFATRVVTLRNPVVREVRDHLASVLLSFEAVQKRIAHAAFELALDYRDSPIVREDRAPVARATFGKVRDDERAGVLEWFDFGTGPQPGDRAPDLEHTGPSGPGRLFASMGRAGITKEAMRADDGKHVLLLFDGAIASEEGYRRFERIIATLGAAHAKWGAEIAVRVVLPRSGEHAAPRFADRVIFDLDGTAHDRYGARAECLYLVRPDGYVAYRGQPADHDRLVAYLTTIFA